MTPPKIYRSALYMPASNQRALKKAQSLDADVIIIDLEDSVAPDEKESARLTAAEALNNGDFGSRHLVLRVNALDTPWGSEDLRFARSLPINAVLVPKLESSRQLASYRAALETQGPTLWAMIETPTGLMKLNEIADEAAANDLGALIVGTNDLAKDLKMRPSLGRAELLPLLTQVVTAARSAGIIVFDGVCNNLEDDDLFRDECAQAVRLGFDGKTLIHPKQVQICNVSFMPTPDEIDWARQIVAAFADQSNDARGAIRLQGRMVERLHLEQAMALLALVEARS